MSVNENNDRYTDYIAFPHDVEATKLFHLKRSTIVLYSLLTELQTYSTSLARCIADSPPFPSFMFPIFDCLFNEHEINDIRFISDEIVNCYRTIITFMNDVTITSSPQKMKGIINGIETIIADSKHGLTNTIATITQMYAEYANYYTKDVDFDIQGIRMKHNRLLFNEQRFRMYYIVMTKALLTFYVNCPMKKEFMRFVTIIKHIITTLNILTRYTDPMKEITIKESILYVRRPFALKGKTLLELVMDDYDGFTKDIVMRTEYVSMFPECRGDEEEIEEDNMSDESIEEEDDGIEIRILP